jgi:hypothetical protein
MSDRWAKFAIAQLSTRISQSGMITTGKVIERMKMSLAFFSCGVRFFSAGAMLRVTRRCEQMSLVFVYYSHCVESWENVLPRHIVRLIDLDLHSKAFF